MKRSREELLLKYLDNELDVEQRLEIQELLENDIQWKKALGEVRRKRDSVLKDLKSFGMDEEIVVPPFSPAKSQVFIGKIRNTDVWKWAAILIIPLVAGFFAIYMSHEPPDERLVDDSVPVFTEDEELIKYNNPNRSWNDRSLVWTVEKIN